MLSDEQLEALRVTHGRIGVIDFAGHQIVLRKPKRAETRELTRKNMTPAEAPDADVWLCQMLVIAYDGEQDQIKAKHAFTHEFLEEFSLAVNGPKFQPVINVLCGVVEEEAANLGKGGARILSGTKTNSPPA